MLDIPKIVKPRNDIPISNHFELINNENIDIHIVLYFISEKKCKIILRRLDDEGGWDNNLQLKLYSLDKSEHQIIHISKHDKNEKIIKQSVTIILGKIDTTVSQKIPKVIIQTDETVKPRCLLHWNSVMTFIELNPEYEYRFYDMSDRREFIKKHFNQDVLNAYDSLVPGSFRSDMFRFCYMYIEGGCYFDSKMILRTPMRNMILPDEDYVLCQDRVPKNTITGILFVSKNMKEFKLCIDEIVKNVKQNIHYPDPLDYTGPGLLGKYLDGKFYKKMIHIVHSWDEENPANFIFKIGNEIVVQKYYKGYYKNYALENSNNTNKLPHYSKLCYSGQVYYKQIQKFNEYIVYIYPNNYDDKFRYEMRPNGNMLIKKSNDKSGWLYDLKLKIINDKTNQDCLMDIGSSNTNMKLVKLSV